MVAKILAIDDDNKYLISIKKLLEIKGFSVTSISNQREILDALMDSNDIVREEPEFEIQAVQDVDQA